MAFWSNVTNAENCERIANLLESLNSRLAEADAQRVADGEKVAQAEQALRVAREALEPFAKAANRSHWQGYPDTYKFQDGFDMLPLTLSDLRRASATLSTEAEAQKGNNNDGPR
jgi:hypothetical protein